MLINVEVMIGIEKNKFAGYNEIIDAGKNQYWMLKLLAEDWTDRELGIHLVQKDHFTDDLLIAAGVGCLLQ